MLRIRSRDTRKSKIIKVGQLSYYDPSGKLPTKAGPVVEVSSETGQLEYTIDENHGGPPYNVGGPFFLSRERAQTPVVASGSFKPIGSTTDGSGRLIAYSGGFVMKNLPSLATLGTLPTTSEDYSNSQLNPNNLQSLGTQAYNRLRPKVEKAGVAQALLEAGDTPRMLRTSAHVFHDLAKELGSSPNAMRMSKKLSDHFLNHVFGWVPFVKDLRDVLSLTDTYFTTVAKTTKDNGKWMNRRFVEDDVLDETTVYNVTRSSTSPLFLPYFSPNVGSQASSASMLVKRQKLTRVWYEGRFRYYRPEFDPGVPMHPQVRSMRQALSLYGMSINPVVVYKVTPWTWMVDWFGQVGGNLQRLQDWADGSVASKYMYLMRTTFDRYEYNALQYHKSGNPTLTGTCYQERVVLRRASAESPFSFTMPPGGLSGGQYAILAALGISRL